MKDAKTIEIVKCDICGDEVEDAEGSADWVYTCSRCGKNFWVSCGDYYHGNNSSAYFSLCKSCIKECKIRDERKY